MEIFVIVHVSLFSFFRWRFRWNGNTPEGWGGGGTPLEGLIGDVRPARVCFLGFLS